MIRRISANSCCTTPSAMFFWATRFGLLFGIGLFVGWMWPSLLAFTDTYVLVALGLACFANFSRNRTLHCGITGPVFLLGASTMGLIEAGLWDIDPDAIWGVALVAVGLAFVFEWRSVGHRRA